MTEHATKYIINEIAPSYTIHKAECGNYQQLVYWMRQLSSKGSLSPHVIKHFCDAVLANISTQSIIADKRNLLQEMC